MRYWDRALSLVEGCTPVSEACLNCWSAAQTYLRSHQKNPKIRARYEGLTTKRIHDGRPAFNGAIRLMWEDLKKPTPGQKPAVWAIWNDLLHPLVPDDFIDKAFRVFTETAPQHTYLVCTKRPERFLTLDLDPSRTNIVFMTTAENQEMADLRTPYLLEIKRRCPNTKVVLSVEPCLGLIDLDGPAASTLTLLDGVILGGETGPGARPMFPGHARKVRDQRVAARVPFFFKQWGKWFPLQETFGPRWFVPSRIQKKIAGRLLDGREWNELAWK